MADFINEIIWGVPLLFLLLGTGLICTVRLGFFQIVKFPFILKNTVFSLFGGKSRRSREKGSITQFQTVTAALAAAMGTGNIVGVATALTIGGAGSIFWMWVSAVPGMALVYGENYLGTLYRRKINGRWYGGPMAYLEYGAGKKGLAVMFAVCCAFAALGMGNMTQVNSISSALSGSFGISEGAVGIVTALVCAVVISGGIKRIGSVTQIMIPFLSLAYMGVALFIIMKNGERIPSAFSEIFRGAFGLKEAGGGISGALISRSINIGLRRGVFSNEAGLGSSAVLHSPSECKDPCSQGMWAVFEVFTDTILCCTLTALAILTTDAMKTGSYGVMLVTRAFESATGNFAPYFIAASISLFAFATIIGWFYCGECGVTYIFGESGVPFYKLIFIVFVYVGAVARLDTVWTVSDIFNGLMAFPNLTGLLLLRKKIRVPQKNCRTVVQQL